MSASTTCSALLAMLALAGAWGTLPACADQVLLDLGHGFDPAKIPASDARVTLVSSPTGPALRIATGHRESWPGITLKAPAAGGGKWDLSPYTAVALDLANTGPASVTVHCRVDNPGADGVKNCLTEALTLKPGEKGTLAVELKRRTADPAGGKLFGMRGYPVGLGGGAAIDPADITQLIVFVTQPSTDHAFAITAVRATGAYTPPAALAPGQPFFPLIDTFGQYVHRDWPGKVHSPAELAEHRAAEAKDLTAQPGPADWDQYGGWKAGPQLEATGFFRVARHEGKWWLVDPEGRLFWSHGIDCVGELDSTPIAERDTWFADFPGKEPACAEFLSSAGALHGYYAGKTFKAFSFGAANAKRKYGADWSKVYAELAHRRLRSWGLNTIANWSRADIYQMRKTPYTATVDFRGRQLEGSSGYWGKFRDVFDPSFAADVQRAMARLSGGAAGDPWCLGFFVDNEIAWGDDTSLSLAALQSPPEQAAKQAFIADLKAKYTAIDQLNQAWSAKYASWDDLAQSRTAPDKQKAAADLHAFYTKTAETYFKTIRDAVKAAAPKQLYLGCRFAWVNNLAAQAAGKYCDVVSYNLYRRTIADFKSPAGDVPLIVGEFHLGALDRGMFHPGLVKVADQAERTKVYRDYVEGALKHPQFVGTHWFKYVDEPTTGRSYDEENYQIGFLDIADTPYPETIAASRAVGAEMYRLRAQ